MIWWALLISAMLLSVERIAYVWISRRPESWRAVCRHPAIAGRGDPVIVVRHLFVGFKILQIAVFLGWCMTFAGTWLPLPSATPGILAAGAALVSVGQFLNVSVFRQLGSTAVFFGGELGHEVPWISGYPFSLIRHPQYVGTVLSIWGLFLVMRYPHPDWWLLPLLETVFYALGACHEA